MAKGTGIGGFGGHADGRTEDAAGHGTPLVDIAVTGGGVERGTRGLIGVVLEAGAIGVGVAEATRRAIAGKCGAVLVEPYPRPALEVCGENRVLAAQSLHAGGQALDIKLVDGEGAVAALSAPWAAIQPGAGAAGGISQCSIHDLHEFPIACRKSHSGKDTGFDCSPPQFHATLSAEVPMSEAHSTIIPGHRYRNAAAAIDWLAKVFGFETHAVHKGEDGAIVHAELTLGGGMIMLGSVTDDEFGRGIKAPDELGGI